MIAKTSFETSPKQPRITWHHNAAVTSQVALWRHECDAYQPLYGAYSWNARYRHEPRLGKIIQGNILHRVNNIQIVEN